jgi:ABC-2 type transport system permease protein
MLMGLLTTRDTIYFLVIAAIFLAMTVSKLRMARDSKKVSFKILRYTLIVIIGVGITYLTSRPGWIGYYDATEIKMNTISKNSQDILKKMGDDPIEVTEYINYLGDGYQNAVPEKRNQDVDRWEQYVRFKPNIHMKWVYYYDSVPVPNHLYKENPGLTAKKIFDTTVKFSGLDADDFKTPAEIRKMVDLGDENARVVMQLKYKDRTTWLRTFNDAEFWPKEPEVMAAMKRMLVTLPRIAFVNDGYERDVQKMGDRDYKVLTNFRTFRYSLINQGFDVDTVSLKTGEIPAGIAALVVADSRTELDPMMLAKIRKYIDGGGNLMVLGEPGKQPINNALMSYMDVRMTDGTIVQRSKDFSYGLVTPWLTSAGGELSGSMKYAREDSVPVSMSGVAGLSCGGGSLFTVRPLLLTDSINDWNKKGAFVLDSAALVYDTANGDQHGAFPTAYSLTRTLNGKEQRILLAGDADFFSNAELSRSNMNTANFLFSNAIFGWFAYGEFPIETTHPRSSDNTVRTSPAWIKTIKVVYFGVIPGLFLIMGTVILIRRKRK